MKTLTNLFAIGLLFSSCQHLNSETVTEFIPGLYVREIDNEFTKGTDTLIISVFDRQAGSYMVVQKSAYTQTIDNKRLSPKRGDHQWLAVYNESTRQLQEQTTGKIFSFSPERSLVMLGNTQYKKVEAH